MDVRTSDMSDVSCKCLTLDSQKALLFQSFLIPKWQFVWHWSNSICEDCKIIVTWLPQNSTADKSTLVQVMVWCRQATSHYLSQCLFRSMPSYGITRPQWVKTIEYITVYSNVSDSLWPSDAILWYKFGSTVSSGNGLAPPVNKPLPEPMLTNHQSGFVAFTGMKFHMK